MEYSLIYYNYNDKKKGQINLDDNSIKGITLFTSKFNNENDLKDYLIQNNLMNPNYRHYTLGILSPRTHELLNYGITYKNDLMYFNTEDLSQYYDTSFIKDYFHNNINNLYFLEYFLKEFYSLRSVPIYNEPLNFLNLTYYNLKNKNYLEDKALYYIDEFIKYYTLRRTKHGYKHNFTNIRNLAMFISSYEKLNYSYNIDDLENEYEHYTYLLDNSANTYEDIIAYNNKLNSLTRELIKRRRN